MVHMDAGNQLCLLLIRDFNNIYLLIVTLLQIVTSTVTMKYTYILAIVTVVTLLPNIGEYEGIFNLYILITYL